MSKYNVGDKVRIVSKRGVGWNYDGGMDKYCDTVMTIRKTNAYGCEGLYLMEEDKHENGNHGWLWSNNDIVGLVTNSDKIVITHDGKTTTATLYRDDGSKEQATARCAPEDDFNFRIGAEIAMGRLVDKLVFSNFNVIRVVFRDGERSYSYKTRMQTAKVGMKIVVPVGSHRNEVNATVVEIIPGAKYNGEFSMSAMKEIDIVEVPQYYNGKVVCVKSSSPWWTVGKIYTFHNGTTVDDDGTNRFCDTQWTESDFTTRNTSMKFLPLVE